MALNAIARSSSGSGVFPALVLVQGNEQKNIVLNRTPFSVGRKVDKDLVIADPRVSRDHAQIILEEDGFFLVDLGSKHGTFVNGERIQRQKLERNDRLELERLGGALHSRARAVRCDLVPRRFARRLPLAGRLPAHDCTRIEERLLRDSPKAGQC